MASERRCVVARNFCLTAISAACSGSRRSTRESSAQRNFEREADASRERLAWQRQIAEWSVAAKDQSSKIAIACEGSCSARRGEQDSIVKVGMVEGRSSRLVAGGQVGRSVAAGGKFQDGNIRKMSRDRRLGDPPFMPVVPRRRLGLAHPPIGERPPDRGDHHQQAGQKSRGECEQCR